MPLTPQRRADIKYAQIFVCFWGRHSATDAAQQAEIAYATALGKPLWVLVCDGTRLPETAFTDVCDLRVAHCPSPEAAAHQVQAWIEETRAPR